MAQTRQAPPETEVYGAFSAILDEVNRMFSIGSLGKWFAMNRIKSHGVRETLDFMQRVAAHGFNAVVTPEEREVLHRAIRRLEVPESDREVWERLQAKMRRMKMAP
jgi:LDH2 family malate/lactate/ureidoglycolate dehydrogenase